MTKKWRAIFWLTLLGLVIFFCYSQYFENKKYHFSVVFFNVGQGDSALINFSNGKKMLVDCGPDNKVLSKLGERLPFYDRTIDYLVITHPDLDHYGGCAEVLKRYRVKNIVENGEKKPNDGYWLAWDEIAGRENAVRVAPNERRQVFDFGLERVVFLKSDPEFLADKDRVGNNNSLVFTLRSSQKSFLFSGDAEIVLEQALINTFCPNNLAGCREFQADYLKIGHHGSDSSTSEEWLGAVRPKVVVVSVGKNSFGHPSLRIVRRLERAGVDIWRTDRSGDVAVNEN